MINIRKFSDDRYYKYFAISDSNRKAYETVVEVVKNLSRLYNPLVIYGPTGVGKTHLVRHAIKTESDAEIVYISAEELINDIVSILRHNRDNEETKIDYKMFFVEKFSAYAGIVIDDIHMLVWKDATQGCVYEIIESLIKENKQIFLITDTPMHKYQVLIDYMNRKLEHLMICNIDVADEELKRKIIIEYGRQYGVDFEDKAIKWLVKHRESTPYLIGTIKRVAMIPDVDNKGSLPAIKKALKEE